MRDDVLTFTLTESGFVKSVSFCSDEMSTAYSAGNLVVQSDGRVMLCDIEIAYSPITGTRIVVNQPGNNAGSNTELLDHEHEMMYPEEDDEDSEYDDDEDEEFEDDDSPFFDPNAAYDDAIDNV